MPVAVLAMLAALLAAAPLSARAAPRPGTTALEPAGIRVDDEARPTPAVENPAGDAPLRPPRGPVAWPAPPRRWAGVAAAIALGALLATAAALGARRLRARRRHRPDAAPPPPSPRATALRALAAVRASGPVAGARVEPHYRALSSVVRRYLEDQLGLRAPERTTEEFIREAARSGLLAPASQELVRAFLEQCDLVKFARHVPTAGDASAALAAAERLVRET